MKILSILMTIAGVLFVGILMLSRDASPLPFQEQHDLLRGSWILKDVPGANPSFYITHSFNDGAYTTDGSVPSRDRGTYRITDVRPDGTFVIEMTSSRYGFTVSMDIEPLDGLEAIKLNHQLFQRSSPDD